MDELPPKYLDFVDYSIYKIFNQISSFLYDINTHPNHITTLSFASGLLSCFLLYNDYYILSGIIYFISYIFDSLDGKYARKYNMKTKFGDHYDHITDISIWLLLFGILLCKIHKSQYIKLFIINFIFISILYIDMLTMNSYKVKKFDKNHSDYFKTINIDDPEQNYKILKYFGTGMCILCISLQIMLFPKIYKIKTKV